MKSMVEALQETRNLPPQSAIEIVRGLTLRRNKGGIALGRLHYNAIPHRNPEINPAWREKHRKTYSSQAAWDREQEIQDLAGGGELVFADILITHWKKIVISDPGWRPHPEWDCKAGFDHGKTNPTALERCYVDFEGRKYFCGEYYMPGKEIWQHAPEIARMADIRKVSECRADPTIFDAVHQQSKGEGEADQKKAKSTNDLYVDEGIELFSKYVGDRSDWSFAQRVLAHWKDLDRGAEPTLFIVCRYPNVDASHTAPMPGLHDWNSPNLLWEMMRTRKEKLTASQLMSRNPSEKIIDKDNHGRDACFVAGTMITTERGPVPIESVSLSDWVLTRAGWRKVQASGMTSADAEIWKVKLSNGSEILTTASHPIWIDPLGFLPAEEIKHGMLCLCLSENMENQKSPIGWASTSTDIPTVKSATLGTTLETAASISTHWSGYLKTAGRFLRSITSTIRTGIASTMSRQILKPCLESPTYDYLPIEAGQKKILSAWTKCAMPQKLGIPAPKAELGIQSTAGSSCGHYSRRIALTVGYLLRTRAQEEGMLFALAHAEQNGVTQTGLTTSKENALIATPDSLVRDTPGQSFVQEHVQVLSVEKTQLRLPVYNVSVEGQPEYFANGILVHNCKYITMSLPGPAEKSKEMILEERLAHIPKEDVTSRVIRGQQVMEELEEDSQPIRMGRMR